MADINLELHNGKIELHYWLNDGSHVIDAFVSNRSELEFLSFTKELAKVFDLEIEIETEALGEGGIKKWFKIISKSEDKKAVITTAILTAILTALLTAPITKISDKLIDKIFEDIELIELEKEIKKYELEKLKLDIQKSKEEIETNIPLKKRRSNFYESVDNYSKITQISIVVIKPGKNSDEIFVEKNDFKNFILVDNDIEPELVEDAVIEIISPVLKKGKHKWWGFYNGEKISFTMKSNEFKTLVQIGEVEFKNGSSINCSLEINKIIDNEGNVRIKDYEVIRVNQYFQNDNPIETNEGRIHKRKLEADKRQMKLFPDDNPLNE